MLSQKEKATNKLVIITTIYKVAGAVKSVVPGRRMMVARALKESIWKLVHNIESCS